MTAPVILTIAISLIALVLVGAAAVMFARRRRSDWLKGRFGSEYERVVSEVGDAREGEAMLAERERRVALLDIRSLSAPQREAFIHAWRHMQQQFVDDPAGAVTGSDVLLGEVMTARGYPLGDVEQRTEDLSVDHADAILHYRTGRRIVDRLAKNEATTEDLRRAMIHYRALFDDLVNEPEDFRPIIEHRAGKVYDLRKEPTRRI